MIVGTMVRCVRPKGGFFTVGRMYPVLECDGIMGEFLTIADDDRKQWCKMRRFDFSYGQEAQA